jgi:hypothetical protein
MDVDIFDIVNENLAKLDKTTKDAIIELIFSFRESVESVWVVFESFDTFSTLVGNVPEKIKQDYESGKSTKFYVDLESLNTNKVELYTNYKESGVQLVGYCVDAGTIYETEIYYDTSTTSVLIKRYDSEMNLLDDQETGYIVDLNEWSGSKDVVDIALKNSLNIKCIKKAIKNQNLLLVKE